MREYVVLNWEQYLKLPWTTLRCPGQFCTPLVFKLHLVGLGLRRGTKHALRRRRTAPYPKRKRRSRWRQENVATPTCGLVAMRIVVPMDGTSLKRSRPARITGSKLVRFKQ